MKALIIEDEHLVAKELQHKIMSLADDIQVIGMLTSLKTAKKWFMQNAEPDLIFMDIQLSDGVSFELFDHFKLACPVIFTTAYDEYAIRAFKVNGADYLLKPIEDEELKRAIDKCRTMVAAKEPLALQLRQLMQSVSLSGGQQPLYKEKFVVRQRNAWKLIDTKDVAFFVRDNLNYLVTFANEKYMLEYPTLEDIEELLDPSTFYRANRQAIIHINAIATIKLHDTQKLTVQLKAPLVNASFDISREKAPAFKKWFDR